MRYVLDSSVALKWVLPEADTPKAVRVRNDYRRGVHELIAPDFFPAKVAHNIAKSERRGIIQPPLGTRRLNGVLNSAPALYSYRVLPAGVQKVTFWSAAGRSAACVEGSGWCSANAERGRGCEVPSGGR